MHLYACCSQVGTSNCLLTGDELNQYMARAFEVALVLSTRGITTQRICEFMDYG